MNHNDLIDMVAEKPKQKNISCLVLLDAHVKTNSKYNATSVVWS